MTFTFTFPIGDAARRDCYCQVDAADEHAARLRMIDRYGKEGWAFVYPSPEQAGAAKYELTEIAFGA